MLPKIIEITPYNPACPQMFEEEALLIKQALGDNIVAIHHIGSTSVPGLAAKPKIDVIVEVAHWEGVQAQLEQLGYIYKGELNIPFRYGFGKRGTIPEFNLHVYEEGNPEVKLNLMFRDYLRTHKQAREEYEALKYALIAQKEKHERLVPYFSEYNRSKDGFIKNILDQAGFNELCLRCCLHYDEWEQYHRIRKEQIFDPIQVVYDPNHPSLTMENHFHFVLYRGTTIVSVAHVELLNETEAVLRSLATDEPFKRKGYASHLMMLLEKWVKRKGRTILKMHANLTAESFYRKRGYADIAFDEPSINPHHVNLGKVL